MSAEFCSVRLTAIDYEITQEFEKACETAARDSNLRWIELESMWSKYIARPYKGDWPGAPRSGASGRRDLFQPNANVEIAYRLAIAAHMPNLAYRNEVRITLEEAMAAPPGDYWKDA